LLHKELWYILIFFKKLTKYYEAESLEILIHASDVCFRFFILKTTRFQENTKNLDIGSVLSVELNFKFVEAFDFEYQAPQMELNIE